MKFFLIFFFSSISSFSFTSGTYNCVEGNNDSICPQIIGYKVISGVPQLKVIYSGYCNDQGPYRYSCENETSCGDIQVSFTKISESSYQWLNKGYNIHCRFELAR